MPMCYECGEVVSENRAVIKTVGSLCLPEYHCPACVENSAHCTPPRA